MKTKFEPKTNLLEDEDFLLLSHFVSFKEKGLHKEAKNCLKLFIEQIKLNTDAKKRKLIQLLCNNHSGNKFVSYPLLQEIIKPTLQNWINEEPNNAEPLKYLASFNIGGDKLSYLQKSLALNPNDDSVLCDIINLEADLLYQNTHYLDESRYLGDPHEDLKLCSKLLDKIKLIKSQDKIKYWEEELKTLQSMIQDWIQYHSINHKSASFKDYCLNQGHDYGFGSIARVYVSSQE